MLKSFCHPIAPGARLRGVAGPGRPGRRRGGAGLPPRSHEPGAVLLVGWCTQLVCVLWLALGRGRRRSALPMGRARRAVVEQPCPSGRLQPCPATALLRRPPGGSEGMCICRCAPCHGCPRRDAARRLPLQFVTAALAAAPGPTHHVTKGRSFGATLHGLYGLYGLYGLCAVIAARDALDEASAQPCRALHTVRRRRHSACAACWRCGEGGARAVRRGWLSCGKRLCARGCNGMRCVAPAPAQVRASAWRQLGGLAHDWDAAAVAPQPAPAPAAAAATGDPATAAAASSADGSAPGAAAVAAAELGPGRELGWAAEAHEGGGLGDAAGCGPGASLDLSTRLWLAGWLVRHTGR
jgi:hypothetical protein